MAQRRMFSLKIVASDAFLEMPTTARELYFQLGMYADDDGFVNPKKILRMVGAADDDLKILLAKRFVLAFENGVVVIKHWLINNLVRKDFYQETVYIDQKNSLTIKENKAYTDRKQIVNNLSPQDRIGKDRIGKNKTPPTPPPPGEARERPHVGESPEQRNVGNSTPSVGLLVTNNSSVGVPALWGVGGAPALSVSDLNPPLLEVGEVTDGKIDVNQSFDQDAEIQKVTSSPRRDIRIIGLLFAYLSERVGYHFDSKQEIDDWIKKNIISAQWLASLGYEDKFYTGLFDYTSEQLKRIRPSTNGVIGHLDTAKKFLAEFKTEFSGYKKLGQS